MNIFEFTLTRLSRQLHISFLAVILLCSFGMILTSCSKDDDSITPEQSAKAKALIGEWIAEVEVDDIEPEDSDEPIEASETGYTVAFLYHFYDDGTCWKEVDIMVDGKLVAQPVDRYSTSECTYTIDANGKVVVEYQDSEEADECLFDGTLLTEEYGDATLTLTRATEAQAKLYQEESDAWHGGAADTKYDVADYKPKGVDNSQWMKQLRDDRLVCDLSLPGSHDACTAEGWKNKMIAFAFEIAAKCQDLTIKEQLKTGVRVFDLRPERDLDGLKWVLRCSHGIAGTKMYVSEFFQELKQFLAANPTEFCIVTIDLSATKDKKAWGKEFSALVGSTEFNSLFADFKARLTVGEMRGRVLLLSKFEYATEPVGGYCYGWVYDQELDKQQQGYITAADGSRTPLWVQDYWKNITRKGKDQALVNMLEASVNRDMTADAPAWVINYPSAYIDGPFSDNYRKNAVSANKLAIDWLETHTGSVGIIYMDFAGMDQSVDYCQVKLYETQGMKLVDCVIKQNWK